MAHLVHRIYRFQERWFYIRFAHLAALKAKLDGGFFLKQSESHGETLLRLWVNVPACPACANKDYKYI
jgi:hypothetical protein